MEQLMTVELVPEYVRQRRGRMAIALMRQKERMGQARFFADLGLPAMAHDCVMAALAWHATWRGERRALQREAQR
jgi:hypothetical protein